jgi:hypothetical protein
MWHAWGGDRRAQDFGWEARKVRDHWEDLDVGGTITLRLTFGRQGSMGELDSAVLG